ncbi:MAG: DUF3179 domain-containing (seleno)protein, partial [Planctomycetota bacterium]
EGVLYRNSFIMYDKGTESLWVHVTGEALKGPLKGKSLRFLPSSIVPWSFWRLEHPDTTVLLGEMVEGMMGAFNLKERLQGYGLSVGEGREVTLFRYELLAAVPVMGAEVGGRPLVLTFDRRLVLGSAYSALVDGEEHHFNAVIPPSDDAESELSWMRDAETGSLWDIRTGRCLSGELAGERLERVPATAWLGKRWRGFFPEGTVVALPKSD